MAAKKAAKPKIEVTRQHINSGGYTSWGRYFGLGAPLYEYYLPSGDQGYIRAADAKSARAKLLKQFFGI